MFDLKKLLGEDPDQLMGELQKLGAGDFDPRALLAGEPEFHSLFLAPFSPPLQEARERFLRDGTGPLSDVAKLFQKQGASAFEATEQARALFAAAVGMCVVVVADEQGLGTVPQLFFGNFDPAYQDQVVALCGELKAADAVRGALHEVRARAESGATWPDLFAPAANPVMYWGTLAQRLVNGLDEGVAPGGVERLRDLAHWIGAACALRVAKPSPTVALAIARCHLMAGEIAEACARLDAALAGDLDEEMLVQVVHHLADTAIAMQQPEVAADWLAPRLDAVVERHGGRYDLALALFKLEAAAQVPAERLVASAERLSAANRKAFRHDLGREPIWRVAVKEPGELLETVQAAEAVGRSPAFISKRLEQGTIPAVRQGDQVRIPKAALLAWKAVVDRFQLLD